MKFNIISLFVLIYSIIAVSAQDSLYYQVSGTVRNDNYEPVDFVHVININLDKGTVTDLNGRFSIVCQKNDSLLFSSVGYKRKYILVPDSSKSAFLFHDLYLENDTIEIKEVMIFPWKTYEEFKKAFLALDISNKDLENAKKNIELIKRQIILAEYSDPVLGHKYTMGSYNNTILNEGVPPYNNLLNPLAWGRFIESLRNGDTKDRYKELRKNNK